MSEFKVIETQEEFNAAISERLKRDREKYAAEFEAQFKEKGWKTPEEVAALTEDLNKQVEKLQNAAASTEKLLAEKDAAIAKGEEYKAENEKIQIALAAGLKYEQAGRLRGNNADEWKQDAKQLASEFAAYAAGQNQPAPLGSGSSGESTGEQFANFFNSVLSTT